MIGLTAIHTHAAVTISEIHAAPLSNESLNEYIELFNDGEDPVDILGWRLGDSKENDTISGYSGGSASLPGKGYAIITDHTTGVYVNYRVAEGALRLSVNDNNLGNGLNNDGETISLWDSDGAFISSAAIGRSERGKSWHPTEEGWKQSAPTPGFSVIRQSPNAGNPLPETPDEAVGPSDEGVEIPEPKNGAPDADVDLPDAAVEIPEPKASVPLPETPDASVGLPDAASSPSGVAVGSSDAAGNVSLTGSCDWRIELLMENNSASIQNVRFKIRAIKEKGLETKISGAVVISAGNGTITGEYAPWANEPAKKQKTSPEYRPKMKAGAYRIQASLQTECEDDDLEDNLKAGNIMIAEKIPAAESVKKARKISAPKAQVKKTVKEKSASNNLSSSITITEIISPNRTAIRFGDILSVKAIAVKGETAKRTVTARVLGPDGAVSNETKAKVMGKGAPATLEFTLALKPNCRRTFRQGAYTLSVDGIDAHDQKSIDVRDNPRCPAAPAASAASSRKALSGQKTSEQKKAAGSGKVSVQASSQAPSGAIADNREKNTRSGSLQQDNPSSIFVSPTYRARQFAVYGLLVIFGAFAVFMIAKKALSG
ncbi:lamin tail domain-containing protein [Candidatus Woesearchaeota archaeon]|nr:lamin tail domain-containing protein [Candidatus Woesearchaeota archaeon]